MHPKSALIALATVSFIIGNSPAPAQERPAPAQERPAPAPEISEKLELCVSCHGEEDGLPVVEKAPILFGQEFYYMFVQLRDYAAGRRENEIMTPIASELDRKQMEALALYFSEQKWPGTQFSATDQEIAIGQTVSSTGQCTQCHLGGFNGNSRVPRLAGQKADYLTQTMLDFKHRIRKNAPDKSSLMEGYSEDDITAMAHYLAGL